ncbi:hypothetical protein MSPP1_000840 [Malassezia sp. CBS 17886]|nr:hypothetical protein MSPP1_000840 [Malassezia sp. CBS 17886]
MRLSSLFAGAALCAAQLIRAYAEDAPELNVVTTFPDNPFSLVQNGRANRVVFTVTNPPRADRAVALVGVSGAFLNPAKADGQKNRVLRNMTATPLESVPVRAADGNPPLQVPFIFFSEFQPQQLEVEFLLQVVDQSSSKRYTIPAYRGTVTVEEPPQSLMDLQLLSVYAVLFALAAAAAYWAYVTYIAPAMRRPKAPLPKHPSAAPAAPPRAEAQGGASAKAYDDEWIPQHNLRPRKPRAGKK